MSKPTAEHLQNLRAEEARISAAFHAVKDAMAERERAERAEAAVLSFQRASGCIDGDTLSKALGNIRHILRDGDGLQNPAEGIPDAAERVVSRAERAEKIADAYRRLGKALWVGGHTDGVAREQAEQDLRALGETPFSRP